MRALITITMALSALRGPLWGVDANPHLLACETPLDGTARVMGEFPAFEGVDTPNAIVSLTHEDGSAFYCSGAPGAEPGAREYARRAESSPTNRGGAAAATRMFLRCVAATPRPPRG